MAWFSFIDVYLAVISTSEGQILAIFAHTCCIQATCRYCHREAKELVSCVVRVVECSENQAVLTIKEQADLDHNGYSLGGASCQFVFAVWQRV